MDVSSLLHRYPCCLLFEQMHESYHRTFLSVKRRFFDPQGISQSSIFPNIWLCFSNITRTTSASTTEALAKSQNLTRLTGNVRQKEGLMKIGYVYVSKWEQHEALQSEAPKESGYSYPSNRIIHM